MKLLKTVWRNVYGEATELEDWINEEVLQEVGGFNLKLVRSEFIPGNLFDQYQFFYKDSIGCPFKLLATQKDDGEWSVCAASFEI